MEVKFAMETKQKLIANGPTGTIGVLAPKPVEMELEKEVEKF